MRKIAVIDDNLTMLNMTKLFLESQGYAVVSAGSAAAALPLVRAERPDAVILDVNLGDGDGRDVCRDIRADAELKGVAILLVSGDKKSAEDVLRGLESSGADGYMLKPVGLAHLGARLKALLEPAGAGTPPK
jgi:two-component system, OmpR family, response regulator